MEDPILWNTFVERKTEYLISILAAWNLYKGIAQNGGGGGTCSRVSGSIKREGSSVIVASSLGIEVSFRYRVSSLRLWRTAVMKRDVKLSLQGHRTIPGCNTYKPRNFRHAPWFLPRKASWERGRGEGETFHIPRRHDPSLSLSVSLYPLSIIWYDIWRILGQSCNEIFSFS